MASAVKTAAVMGWTNNQEVAEELIAIIASRYGMEPKYAEALLLAAADTLRANK